MAEMDDVEALAIELWHRYAPSHHMGWADEPAKEEYRDPARAAIAALQSRGWQKVEEGMCVVPVDVVQFDCTRYPAMEAAAIDIAARISGKRGEPPLAPDPVQVLEDAEKLFKAGMADFTASRSAPERKE